MAYLKVWLAKHHRMGLTVAASLGIHGALMGVPMSFDAEPPKPESLSVVPLTPLPARPTTTAKPTLPVSSLSTPPPLPKFNPSSSFQWSPFSPPSNNFGSSIASNIASGNFGDRTSTSVTNWQQFQQQRAEEAPEAVTEETVEEQADEVPPTETSEQSNTSGTQVTDEGTPDNPSETSSSKPLIDNNRTSKKPEGPDLQTPTSTTPSTSDEEEGAIAIAEQTLISAQKQIDDESSKFLETLPPDSGRSYISSSTPTGLDGIKTYLQFASDIRNALFNGDGSKKNDIVSIHMLTGKHINKQETRSLFIKPFEDQGFQIGELEPTPNEPDRQKYQAKIKEKPYFKLELIPIETLGTLLVVWKYDPTGTI
jgi:hypothetical protein